MDKSIKQIKQVHIWSVNNLNIRYRIISYLGKTIEISSMYKTMYINL